MLRRLVLAGALVLLVTSLGRTQTVSLPQTGQSVCYSASGAVVACPGSGQDAAVTIGVDWPVPRFAANANDTVTDQLTGLTWTELTASPGVWLYSCSPSDSGESLSWSQALALVSCLNSRSY